jgi:mRNA-degrading endonuclease toxin of MazEF toxin-antitoxin module
MGVIHSGVCLFLHKPGDPYAKDHLWIVLTEPHGNPGEVVIVSLTTKRSGSDLTVILHPGDHSFIKHETVVSYMDSRKVEEGNLVSLLAMGRDRRHDDCSEELLAHIRQGLLDSPFTPNKIKTYCAERWGKT